LEFIVSPKLKVIREFRLVIFNIETSSARFSFTNQVTGF